VRAMCDKRVAQVALAAQTSGKGRQEGSAEVNVSWGQEEGWQNLVVAALG